MSMVWPCHSFMDGLSSKCISVYKKVKLINHYFLPILMLLYIMLYIMLAYLMLFAVLSNAVCLYNVSFFSIYFCKCLLFSCFVLVYCHIVCLFYVLTCTMRSAFNLLVFRNSMFTSSLFFLFFFNKRAMCSP